MNEIFSSLTLPLALGAHIVVPARLAGAGPSDRESTSIGAARRAWALSALPLLLISTTTVLLWLSRSPDGLIGAGWGTSWLTTSTVRATGVLLLMLVVIDILLVPGHLRLEPRGWRALALAGWPTLVVGSLCLEIVRVGPGPRTTAGALAVAVLCRIAVALGAAEALAPSPRHRWASWTLAAGVLLPVYPLTLPPEVRHLLWRGGEALTLVAATILFLTARALPPRLQRPAILAAALLAALVFARTTELATTFPVHLRPLPAL